MSNALFSPYTLGDVSLSNRMVMAPLTRSRSDMNGLATPVMVTYYQQRASAGLIITESTPISSQGIGYPMTPGIFTQEQVESWKNVIEAVHNEGSKIFIQLQHCGRISHPDMQENGAIPVSSSAIKPEGHAYTYEGPKEYVTPHALTLEEIKGVVSQFKDAAIMAKDAGFDGIEIHGANGYLIDQFLRDGSNVREDEYGGSVENRMRFLSEVLDAVLEIWDSARVGVRISPENSFNSMSDSDPQRHFEYIVSQLDKRGLAYLHVLEGDMMSRVSEMDYTALKDKFAQTYIANNGYDFNRAVAAIEHEEADIIAFGVPFISNPDLVMRYKNGWPLSDADQATFYMGGEKGYIDYPFYKP